MSKNSYPTKSKNRIVVEIYWKNVNSEVVINL